MILTDDFFQSKYYKSRTYTDFAHMLRGGLFTSRNVDPLRLLSEMGPKLVTTLRFNAPLWPDDTAVNVDIDEERF